MSPDAATAFIIALGVVVALAITAAILLPPRIARLKAKRAAERKQRELAARREAVIRANQEAQLVFQEFGAAMQAVGAGMAAMLTPVLNSIADAYEMQRPEPGSLAESAAPAMPSLPTIQGVSMEEMQRRLDVNYTPGETP